MVLLDINFQLPGSLLAASCCTGVMKALSALSSQGAALDLTAVTLTLVKATQLPGATTCFNRHPRGDGRRCGWQRLDRCPPASVQGNHSIQEPEIPSEAPFPSPLASQGRRHWPTGRLATVAGRTRRRADKAPVAAMLADAAPHRALTTSSAVIFNIVTLGQQPAPQPQRL